MEETRTHNDKGGLRRNQAETARQGNEGGTAGRRDGRLEASARLDRPSTSLHAKERNTGRSIRGGQARGEDEGTAAEAGGQGRSGRSIPIPDKRLAEGGAIPAENMASVDVSSAFMEGQDAAGEHESLEQNFVNAPADVPVMPVGGYVPEVVSGKFARTIEAWAPEIYRDEVLFRLFAYLALGSYYHRDLHRLQLPYELLAFIAGDLTHRVRQRETYPGALQLLERIKEALGRDETGENRFTWSEHAKGKYPRLVDRFNLPADIASVVEKERRRAPGTPLRLVSGRRSDGGLKSHTRKEQSKHERKLDVLLRQKRCDALYAPSRDVLGYLDRLPSNSFSTIIRQHWDDALGVIDETWREDRKAAHARRTTSQHDEALRVALHQKNILERKLAALGKSSKQRYTTSPSSARLFPTGAHIGSLPSAVRRALTGDWVEVDLQAVYLGAAPRFLDVPQVENVLGPGDVSVWEMLIDDLGLGPLASMSRSLRKVVKGALKHEGVYPLLMNRQLWWMETQVEKVLRQGLQRELCITASAARSMLPAGLGNRLARHPLIQDLTTGRDDFFSRVKLSGFAFDHHGAKIALPGYAGAADYHLGSDATEATLLSYVLSRVEMDLLKSVLDLQREQKGARFRVMIWQHDGASLKMLEPTRCCPACTIAKAQGAVAMKAEDLGVYTRLKVDHDPAGYHVSRETCRGCNAR